MVSLLKKMTQKFGVSGNEVDIKEFISGEINSYVDEINVDTMGNLIALKKGKGKKVMLIAHMDVMGLMVTFIDDNGFLRFVQVGEMDLYSLVNKRVKFRNGTIGTIFIDEKINNLSNINVSNLYIDIGVYSKKEAEEYINIGDSAALESDFVLQGNSIISSSLDNRCGCTVLVEVIKKNIKTENEIYYVFSSQEEIGSRGIATTLYQVMPDISIIIDVSRAGDIPKKNMYNIKLGKGPAIRVKDGLSICNIYVKNKLIETANNQNIPYQLEVMDYKKSDVYQSQITAGGILSGAVSIPCRYVHSSSEQINIVDIENTIKLVQSFIRIN